MSYAIDRSLRTYRALPAISGRSFLPVSFLGRLPATMAPLAMLTFTASATGSYATAGLATTVTAGGSAVGAPLMGLLADRWGQRPVLSVAVVVNALALATLALLSASGYGRLLVLCAVIGLTMPQVGGMARARWLALTRRHAGTAMAYEGTADEVAYVAGPALAGLLASVWGPPSALLAAAGAGVLCAGAFALHPTHASTRFAVPNRVGDTSGGQLMTATSGTQPATAVSGEQVVTGTSGKWLMTATSRQQVTAAGLLRLVWVPVLAMLLMGAFFAAVQSTLTMYATAAGRPAAAGLIYALMAVGSAGTALGTAVLPERIGPALRCAGCAIGLSLGVLLIWTTIAVSGSLVWLCGAVLLTGLSVGPMLVTLNQVAGARVPMRRSATAMSFLSAGAVVGVALGATSAGALADAVGGGSPLSVAAAASGLLFVLACVGLHDGAATPSAARWSR